ncbi:MAG: M14 family zinc carboxypeptidase [Thermomicrobiales bacterium]
MAIDIRAYMAAVPEIDRFLSVDELHAEMDRVASDYPDLASVKRVGSSTLGEPIRILSIGSGSRNIVLVGCPHPNEPIGAMMLHHLARTLCEDAALRDALDFTWHMIPAIDVDGTRLNEGWFAGPFTPKNYARHFYRPAPDNQVEWTFPNSYKTNYFDRTMPETEALMRIIDDVRPELIVSLHNAGFGGVYYYLGRELPAVYPTLTELPGWEDLPLSLGEPEVPFAKTFAPAIFSMISTEDTVDYLEENGVDISEASYGGSSASYAAKYGSLCLVTEMAYYDDPRVNDQTVTDVNRRQAILESLDRADEITRFVSRQLEAVTDDLKAMSPFRTAVTAFNKDAIKNAGAERSWAEKDPDTDRPATVAELFSSRQESRFYRLLQVGMLVRMLEGELAIGNGTPRIRKHLAESLEAFTTWADALEADLDYRVVPIRKLVAIHLGSTLAVASALSADLAQ